MIAHHFPPSGGSGANRALAFARYLPAHGWDVTVLTPAEAYALNRDDALVAELPRSLRVLRTRSLEPHPERPPGPPLAPPPRHSSSGLTLPDTQPSSVGQRASRLRRHLGHLKRFPDAHLGWLPFAFAAARGERFDLIYSTSGPFTSHLIALLLKLRTRKPWVAELRDGWYRWNRSIFPDYPAWRDALESRVEAVALARADRVILVTERMASAFRAQYPSLPSDHFTVVPNGFDPGQFAAPADSPGAPTTFEVLHSGSLYYGRSLTHFLAAAASLIAQDPDFRQSFQLTLLGTLDHAAQAELARHRFGGRVHFVGQVDHQTALRATQQASLLLLVANTTPGAEATVPGKLFEYLASGRPTLAIAPTSSSTADILEATGGGYLVDPDDTEAIACALGQAFAGFRHGLECTPDQSQAARYDRRRLAGDLACIFTQVITRTASHARRP
jgi:glycosyltransferase involved in cell wall biosynthesis